MQQQVDPAILPEGIRKRLVALCRQYGVRDLALFGSAANGGFDPGTSDVDFLVSFEPMPPAEHMRSYFGLLEGLEALFGRTVDLVEHASIRNPFVLGSILESKVDLYAAA
ncbi:MAG: nucleotidyltransferase domain-containing protein [Methanospirillum sp.]